MSYIKTGAAHTNQLTEDLYGNEQTRYSRYETGFIEGEYRDMLALIADETGFDGLGFDAKAGSNDDSWHVVNLFENGGHYVDSVAIGGALDEDHALSLATTQFDHLGADYGVLVGYADGMQFDCMTDNQAWSIDAISKLLNNPSQDKHYLPIITSKELQIEATRAAFDDVQWDNLTLSSHGGNLNNLYTDVRRADTFQELTQEFDLQQALIDLEAEEAEFDSIMDTVNRLPMLKDRLFRAMSQASNETLYVTNVTQTKPFKRGGVVNVAFVFDLSDGQKLSIWFHNPDSTPSKLLAGDMMVSWKWLLNKRDVTAILSPINGQDVKIPTLARQMMLLASKNSKNFKRAQERKAKRDADINEAQSNIEQKKQTIEQLDKDIASLKDQIDAAMKANKGKADKDTTETTNNDSSQDMNIQVNSIDIDSLDIEPRYKKRLLDGVQRGLGILDTAAQTKLKQKIESLKTQLTSMGVSFISESEYQEKINSNEESGFSVQSLQDDLKESVSQLHKLVNKQIRPSKIVGTGYKDNRAVAFENLGLNIAENEVVLRTQPSGFYKTVNLSNYETYLDVLVSSSKKANEGVTTASQIEPKEVPKSDVETYFSEAPYVSDAGGDVLQMSGFELGKFPDTPEGKKQLRQAAKDAFNQLRGQWVDCPSLKVTEGENAKVEIRRRSIKEFMAFSGDTRKLKLVPKIKNIIETASLPDNGWQENKKMDKKRSTVGYYHLENKVRLDDELLSIKIVIEKDNNGLLHYDVLVPKFSSQFDHIKMSEQPIPDNYSGGDSDTDNIKSNYTDEVNMFDSIEDDYEINIEILEVLEQGNSSKQAEDNFVDATDKSAKEKSITSQLDPKEALKSDFKTFSPENPYARYADNDEDAMANAERWEARKVLTEKGLEKLNELAESFGFTTFIESRHAGLGVFQAVKEVSNRRVEIEGKFKNYDGESAKESPNDFTIEWSQDGEVVDYQYTNDLPEYIEKANNWLNQDIGSLNEQNVATLNTPEDIEMTEQEVSDIGQGHAMQQTETAYSQDDINYLNSIIDGSLSTEDIDLDKLTVIGEKDEHNPLFGQALDVVLSAVDKESSDL